MLNRCLLTVRTMYTDIPAIHRAECLPTHLAFAYTVHCPASLPHGHGVAPIITPLTRHRISGYEGREKGEQDERSTFDPQSGITHHHKRCNCNNDLPTAESRQRVSLFGRHGRLFVCNAIDRLRRLAGHPREYGQDRQSAIFSFAETRWHSCRSPWLSCSVTMHTVPRNILYKYSTSPSWREGGL